MRRLLAIVLICLLPLHSFAGVVMGERMASMGIQMSSASLPMSDDVQAPCHEALQAEQSASKDCCDVQGMCYSLCQMWVALPVQASASHIEIASFLPHLQPAAFQSADPSVGLKPPIFPSPLA